MYTFGIQVEEWVSGSANSSNWYPNM